ncbi:hypothetical protein VTL71DRAFT_7808 [Oculimacula yallundae]|uniref:RING-type E3 ubiquitin transferase n=1 Tax=Oculimacula yallundae TaxID=86028 RepID=A0ABR4CVQ9_9HELO
MPIQQPPQQEYARVVLIIVLLFFLYTSPDQGTPPGFQSPHDYAAERLDRFRHSLDVLNRTKWQDFAPKTADKSRFEAARYLNLTGFREDDEYAWERVDAFKTRSQEFTKEAKRGSRLGDTDDGAPMEVFQNVTGIVKGKWVRNTADLNGAPRIRSLNMTETSPAINWAFTDVEYWTRNVTGTSGKLMLRLEESDQGGVDMSPDAPEDHKDLKAPIRSLHTAREVSATLTIQDESSSGDGWDMRVHGVHWPTQGVMLMTTTSEKFSGIFGLPHLTMNSEQFMSSQRLLNKTLERKLEGIEKSIWIDLSNPWSSSPNDPGDGTLPVPHCEYVVYVQIYPIELSPNSPKSQSDPASIISAIEQELRFPDGAPITKAPSLKMSTVIFSPDCGFMLESMGPPIFAPADGTHLNGKKNEMFLHDIQKWLRSFAAVIFVQTLLLKLQSQEASTPSTVGRVSLYTVAVMLMADALLFSSMSLLSATAQNLFPSALLTSFSALMSVALGVRFISAVYSVQEPERREALRAQLAAEAAARPPPISRPVPTPGTVAAVRPIITAAGVDVAPQTVAIPAPAPVDEPIIVPSDQDFDVDTEIAERATAAAAVPLLPTTNRPAIVQTPRATSSFGAVYIKFSLLLSFILFLSIFATSWPVPLRTAYINTLSFIYLSFWTPQIRRNVIRNCRKALLWKFIIGQSVLRLLPFAYFYLRDDNILFADTDWKAFSVLAGWVWIQILILVGQEILGPRWGLPKSWYEEGWNYHPILSEDNVESGGLPIGLVRAPGSPTLERARTSEDMGSRTKKDGNTRSVDCAICMQLLEVPVVAAGVSTSAAGSVVEMLARRQYMVTPCKHIFHSACLEGWMRFRLQCPICRENLPPL